MRHRQLKHKPLVEAILEIRWGLQSKGPGMAVDPHYKLLLARLFDKVHGDYPEYEQLPTADIPDQFLAHQVQYRFRSAANAWPLIQLGPGILTLNSTSDYTWDDFRPRALSARSALLAAYPKSGDLKITQIVLRYIDAVSFDYTAASIFEFLKAKMGVQVALPERLFDGHDISPHPPHFSWESSFQSRTPKGNLLLRFATGQHNQQSALIWETTFDSKDDAAPGIEEGFEAWLDGAHQVANDCFFELIKGELKQEFSGE